MYLLQQKDPSESSKSLSGVWLQCMFMGFFKQMEPKPRLV